MATNIVTSNSPHLLQALEDNMVAFWKGYGIPAGRRLDEGGDRVSVLTGIPEPLFNAVYSAHLAPDAVETAVEDIRLDAAEWNVPLFWWLTPTTTPADLGHTLLKHGFVHAGTVPGMAVELAQLAAQMALPRDLTIKVVEDNAALGVWADIAAVGTGFAEPVAAMVRTLELEVGLQPANGLRRYLGYLGGVPVSGLGVALGGRRGRNFCRGHAAERAQARDRCGDDAHSAAGCVGGRVQGGHAASQRNGLSRLQGVGVCDCVRDRIVFAATVAGRPPKHRIGVLDSVQGVRSGTNAQLCGTK